MSEETENWTVPKLTAVPVVCMTFVILGVCMTGMGQTRDRDTRGVPATSATAPPPEARIDINHASLNELLKVTGMTPTWAGRIVRFRPYRSKADLLDRGLLSIRQIQFPELKALHAAPMMTVPPMFTARLMFCHIRAAGCGDDIGNRLAAAFLEIEMQLPAGFGKLTLV